MVVMLLTLLVTLGLAGGQTAEPAPAGPATVQSASVARLPVSVDRIKRDLVKPVGPIVQSLSRPVEQPVFHVVIQEKRLWVERSYTEARSAAGPVPRGGLHAYEQMLRTTPPEFRPYAGFGPGQLLWIAADTLFNDWVTRKVIEEVKQKRKQDRTD